MSHSATADPSAQTQAVTGRVVDAVADFTDSDPLSLEPLYTVVDPDALAALFETNGTGGGGPPSRVAFTYCGCEVEISSDGTVHVSEPDRKNEKTD